MKWYALFGVLLIPGCVGQTSAKNPTSTKILQRMTALENLVASVQTQSTTNEQKYAALISNILAKLSTNSDEIRNMKSMNDHLLQARNATLITLAQTQTQLGTVSKELADLKLDYDKCYQRSLKLESVLNMTRDDVFAVQSNMTDVQLQLEVVLLSVHGPTPNVSTVSEMSSKINTLEASFNQSDAKLNLFLTKINTTTSLVNTLRKEHASLKGTVNSLKSSSQSNSIYFKILLQHDLSLDLNSKDGTDLKFSVAPGSVTCAGYSSSTGKFTASVSGTYVFWADILVSRAGGGYIYIVKDGTAFAQGTTLQKKNGIVRSVWGVTPLKKGQQVWFRKEGDRISTTFKGNGESSYGGAILHSG